ncbi:MAG: hypothetical protein IT445_11065, partial [Phycisphaeraceae bacterium]|nr:hypothetical protein [Phycisphaeraceae bacterium]
RTHAAHVVRQVLSPILLLIGDVLGLFADVLDVIGRCLHRITQGRSAPRAAHRIKPHARFAYKG